VRISKRKPRLSTERVQIVKHNMSSARKERAALMEQRKAEERKSKPPTAVSRTKTASSTTSVSSSGRPKQPILYSASGMAGTGLWCQPTDNSLPTIEERERDPSPPKPVTTELTVDLEQKVNKELIATLERKATKLAAQLDKEIISKRELQLRIQTLEQSISHYKSMSEEALSQAQEHAGKTSALEEEMDQHALYRNYATTQLETINKELENERSRAEAYYQMYEELTKRHEDELAEYAEEVESLKQRVEEAQADRSSLAGELMESRALLEQFERERRALGEKLTEEVASAQTLEERTKSKSSKMNILIGENHALSQRVKELEEGKKRALESVKKREEETKEVKAALESLAKRLKSESDLRKHQSDLVAQRDYRMRLIQDRYEKVQIEIEDLIKENERLKEALEQKARSPMRTQPRETEELIPVKANPRLAL